jgi:hypothetical protein
MVFLSAETGKTRDSVRRRSLTTVDGHDDGITFPKVVSRGPAKAKAVWMKVVDELRLAGRTQGGTERKQDRKTSVNLRRSVPVASRPRGSFVGEMSASRNKAQGLRTFILIERSDADTVLLAWHGSTQGRVTDQPWTRLRADGDARCAMSGQPIESGDLVYRPVKRRGESRSPTDIVLARLIDDQSPISVTH